MFEEWISYPDRREFVPVNDHGTISCQRGWWSTGWRGTAMQVAERKGILLKPAIPDLQLEDRLAEIDA